MRIKKKDIIEGQIGKVSQEDIENVKELDDAVKSLNKDLKDTFGESKDIEVQADEKELYDDIMKELGAQVNKPIHNNPEDLPFNKPNKIKETIKVKELNESLLNESDRRERKINSLYSNDMKERIHPDIVNDLLDGEHSLKECDKDSIYI